MMQPKASNLQQCSTINTQGGRGKAAGQLGSCTVGIFSSIVCVCQDFFKSVNCISFSLLQSFCSWLCNEKVFHQQLLFHSVHSQVSYFSTSPELSNKQRFEYFSRTIPSDHYQVKAMVEIVKSMGWTYVSIIYEESNYGIKVSSENIFPAAIRRNQNFISLFIFFPVAALGNYILVLLGKRLARLTDFPAFICKRFYFSESRNRFYLIVFHAPKAVKQMYLCTLFNSMQKFDRNSPEKAKWRKICSLFSIFNFILLLICLSFLEILCNACKSALRQSVMEIIKLFL